MRGAAGAGQRVKNAVFDGTGEGGEIMEREQTTIRLPVGLKEQLQREADRQGISFNALVIMILSEERNHRQTK